MNNIIIIEHLCSHVEVVAFNLQVFVFIFRIPSVKAMFSKNKLQHRKPCISELTFHYRKTVLRVVAVLYERLSEVLKSSRNFQANY